MANVASSTVVGGGSDNSVVADVDSVSVDVDPVVTEVDPVLAQVTEADSELTEVGPVVAEVDSNGPVVAGSHRGHAAELTQTEPTAKPPPAIRGRAFWDQFPPGSALPWSQLPERRMLPDHLFDPSDAAPYPAKFRPHWCSAVLTAIARGEISTRPPPCKAQPQNLQPSAGPDIHRHVVYKAPPPHQLVYEHTERGVTARRIFETPDLLLRITGADVDDDDVDMMMMSTARGSGDNQR